MSETDPYAPRPEQPYGQAPAPEPTVGASGSPAPGDPAAAGAYGAGAYGAHPYGGYGQGSSGPDPYAANQAGQQPYGAAQYGYATPAQYPQPAYGYAAGPGTDGLAVSSLVCGVLGLTVVPFVASIVALVLGLMSLSRLKTSGQNGRGLAIGGVVLGVIGLFFLLVVIVGLIAFTGLAATRDFGVAV
ncbi:DUF4190 domain-containing protein [Xylanimonas ulmi]|uniref:Uncharacterized protein DUF4190 n=1 Tax=Xylanimonas ulmi TaxID=228973 RepID=A0A4Q7M2Z2_9MICO|nr:DUF4190 domain-containing protein [Xylanibacterium ulmi]RZS61864.1 uncharacterized protein DUF4190 [Xylanibacterium ulmi]